MSPAGKYIVLQQVGPEEWRASPLAFAWSISMGKKSGGPCTPTRPAFAFLVTPKLPLGGRSVKNYGLESGDFPAIVN